MKKMLRTRFHSDETWGEGIVSDPRTTHALIILSSDLSNGNVGFEGWGYFTITYSLIGSVSFSQCNNEHDGLKCESNASFAFVGPQFDRDVCDCGAPNELKEAAWTAASTAWDAAEFIMNV